jgi:hypothetical protein
VLGYCAARPADAVVGGVPMVWIARLATLYYFAFFWLIMPIAGLVEVPDRLPASIAESLQAGAASRRSSRLSAEGISTLESMFKWGMTRRRQS